jgi:hypothetical protein
MKSFKEYLIETQLVNELDTPPPSEPDDFEDDELYDNLERENGHEVPITGTVEINGNTYQVSVKSVDDYEWGTVNGIKFASCYDHTNDMLPGEPDYMQLFMDENPHLTLDQVKAIWKVQGDEVDESTDNMDRMKALAGLK